LRGGTVIDFLVQTAPLQTPLYVMGEYFHGTIQAERDRLTMLLLSGTFHGIYNQPVVLLGADLQTQDASDEAVLRLFGRVQ
jgi:CobQ-like glutamine amidotransferase family enzyme